VSWCRGDEGGKARYGCNCNQEECEMFHKGFLHAAYLGELQSAVLKKPAGQIKKMRLFWVF
jgi:hypothetical protein